MLEDLTLRAPIRLIGDDVEKAVLAQCAGEVAVPRDFDQLHGAAAERAADELNRALEVDIFDMLAQGWVKVPSVRNAVDVSKLTQGPPALVNLQHHKITSTSRLVLDSKVAQTALPPLTLTLEMVAEIQCATVSAYAGRIEPLSLGDVSVIMRLKCKGVLVKEHETGVRSAQRNPFKARRAEPDVPTSVDIQI
jgi:hypothetical protein